MFYAGKSFDDGFVNTAIFDSFYGGIYLPRPEWLNTFKEVQANMTRDGKNFLQCNNTDMSCFYQGECKYQATEFYDIAFNFIDDRAYQVSPKSYLQDAKDAQGRNICKVLIYGNLRHDSEFILGDVFMQSLYVLLDYENSKFAVNGDYTSVTALNDKPYRPDENTPATTPNKNLVWIIIGSVVGVLVIVAVVGFLIVRRKNRRLQDNLAKYETL